MRDLSLVGLSEDRRHVVLRSPSGEAFRIPADDRLRAALRGDKARLGQLEIQMDSALRPRDIQARIRRGESAEAVAEAAQVPVERIMAYAVPVLAEREHVCDRARTATIRRSHVSGQAALFGDAIGKTLRTRDVDATDVTWDSWRRADGRWVVSVDVPGEEGPALYLFDAPGRYVVADNERASRLVGDVADYDTEEMAIATAITDEPEGPATDEIPVVDAPVDEDVDEPGVTSLKRARARRALAQEQLLLEGDESAPAVPPESTHPDPPEEPEGPAAEADETTTDLPETATQARAAGDDTHPAPSEQTDAPPKRSRRRERRRVPSWDEIMFGNKTDE
ncbi:MAG: septation protein SepH [Nocardioidaceae bacterium]